MSANEGDSRPESVEKMLLFVADWLDKTDRLIEAQRRLHHPEQPSLVGTGVQNDLRSLAGVLAQHPQVDRDLYDRSFAANT